MQIMAALNHVRNDHVINHRPSQVLSNHSPRVYFSKNAIQARSLKSWVTILPTHTGGGFLLFGTGSARKPSISLKSLSAMRKVNKIYATENFTDL